MTFSPGDLLNLLGFSLALFLAAAGTPLVARLACRLGAISQPRGDRWHQAPTPLLGGIAIYVAILLGALVLGPPDGRLAGLLLGTTIIFALGLVDDLRTLPPHAKLFGQIAAACVLLVAGVRVDLSGAPPLAPVELGLTVFWVIGITNAFNLLDNMDGLSAGTAAIAAGMLFVHSAARGEPGLALLSLVVAGAAAGFLVHNFHPATIFMGDCGSMTLGFVLASLGLMSTHGMTTDVFLAMLVPVAILGLPIFDTTLVTLVRRYHGRPVSLGGRDHSSHRLVALGLSERGAVLVLYGITLALGAIGLAAIHLDAWTSLALGALAAVAITLFGVYLAQVRVYADHDARPRGATHRWDLVLRPERWLRSETAAMGLDLVLIALAYLLAYLLKYEGNLSGPFLQNFAVSLPFLVAIKLTVLLVSGVYRAMWRYFSTVDACRVALASALGSALSVVAIALVFGFGAYSRSVFVIDWLLLTTLLIGTRMSFALLGDWFAGLPRAETTRVLILGADDHGDLVLRSILRHPAYRAVAFDSDPTKQHRRLSGVPVLGTPRDVMTAAVRTGAHEVIVATPLPARQDQDRFIHLCREVGIGYYEASVFLRQHLPDGEPIIGAGA